MSNLVPVDSVQLQPAFDRHAVIQMAVEKRNALVEFVKAIMQSGTDYGVIPGTDKPTLLKPGAEKLCTLYTYLPSYEVVEKVEDWTGVNHNGEPFFYYWYRCKISDQNGRVIATGEGSVNSWEKKYRYRDAKPVCPHCGQMTINKSKKVGEGFYCWAKIGGCGATFPEGDPQITSQAVGKMPNPDIFDQVNTIMKMSQKRAFVAAVLLACNASEFFTQDMEDMTVIDAQIVTTAPASRSAPIKTVVSEATIPMSEVDELTALTGHTAAQVFTIAANLNVNPDSMSHSEWHSLREGLLGAWAFDQGGFKAKVHAFNAVKKVLLPSMTNQECFDAVAADVAGRKAEGVVSHGA